MWNNKTRNNDADEPAVAESHVLQARYHLDCVWFGWIWGGRTCFGSDIAVVAQRTRASPTQVGIVARRIVDWMQKTDEDNGHVVTTETAHLTVGCKATRHQLLTDLNTQTPQITKQSHIHTAVAFK